MEPKKHITVGVAGHVDHGKTALVRALTGMETDRLPEEQARGMSIALGFAHLALPGGEVDLIDVPGHGKFIRTMISGATGMDAALLVIAANERVKPQTVEHLALMGLLGVKAGLVAVTKSDLAPHSEERERIAGEVREFVHPTFLRDAPLVFTSAVTGEGLDAIQAALQALLADAAPPPEQPWFYLPVDRAFTLTGHGTVVTGTLRRGPLRLGQTVELWPGGGRAEVRGLEVHGQAVQTARPGWRTAVNLRGVKKDDIRRGDALATPGVLRTTRLLDAELTLLPTMEKPLKRGQTVQLHYGTTELPARVYPLGQESIPPGETAWVQLRLGEDVVVPVREPFVIRAPSPAETLGGGVIIDPYPQKHTRADADVLGQVQTLAQGSPAERVREKLRQAGPAGRSFNELLLDLGVSPASVEDAPAVLCSGGMALHPDVFDGLQIQAQDTLHRFHQAHPIRRGMPLEELRRSLPRTLNLAAFPRLLEALTTASALETGDGLAREPGHSPEAGLSAVEHNIAQEIEGLFRSGGLQPPGLDETLKKDRRRKTLYHFLVEAGTLVPVTERTSNRTVVFHRDAIAEAKRLLQTALAEGEGKTVSELNALWNTTRKFSIPLLEHLDGLGVTRREGDLRYLQELMQEEPTPPLGAATLPPQ